MKYRRIGCRQRFVWVAAGLSAAVTAMGCGLGWPWMLAGGLICILYYIVCSRQRPCGAAAVLRIKARPLAWLTALWTVLAVGWTACLADSAFPMDDGFPALGWILLLLAAFAAGKGPAACAGTAGVLCLFLAGLYSAVTAFAVPDVSWEYLKPAAGELLPAVGLFLLPAPIFFLRTQKPPLEGRCRPKAAGGVYILLPVLAAILTAVSAGVLSPELAASSDHAFYDLARSVSILGVMERIEPLVSAAMTMGVFCLLTGQLCAVAALVRGKFTPYAAAAAGGIFMFPAKCLPLTLFTAGNVLFWVLPTFVTLSLQGAKGRGKPFPPTDSA